MNRNNIAHTLPGLLLIIMICSCSKDLKLPDISDTKKITLIGELVANDTVYIRAGQSSAISSGTLGYYELAHTLSVRMTDATGTTQLSSAPDSSFLSALKTIPYYSNKNFISGKTYNLFASHSEMGIATASITIPTAFTATIQDTGTQLYANKNTMRFDVKIDDGPGDNFYVIEAVKQKINIDGFFFYNNQWLNIIDQIVLYDSLKIAGVTLSKKFDTTYTQNFIRQSIYTNDPNTENLADGTALSPNRRILIKDNSFNNSSYTVRVFVDKSVVSDVSDNGRILFQVKSVPAEYFTFLKAYEQYDPSNTYNATALPVKIKGNVSNGFGMIGAACKLQFVYIFDNWPFF